MCSASESRMESKKEMDSCLWRGGDRKNESARPGKKHIKCHGKRIKWTRAENLFRALICFTFHCVPRRISVGRRLCHHCWLFHLFFSHSSSSYVWRVFHFFPILFTDCEITQVMIMITQVSLSNEHGMSCPSTPIFFNYTSFVNICACYMPWYLLCLYAHRHLTHTHSGFSFVCRGLNLSISFLSVSSSGFTFRKKFILWRFNFNSEDEARKKDWWVGGGAKCWEFRQIAMIAARDTKTAVAIRDGESDDRDR